MDAINPITPLSESLPKKKLCADIFLPDIPPITSPAASPKPIRNSRGPYEKTISTAAFH